MHLVEIEFQLKWNQNRKKIAKLLQSMQCSINITFILTKYPVFPLVIATSFAAECMNWNKLHKTMPGAFLCELKILLICFRHMPKSYIYIYVQAQKQGVPAGPYSKGLGKGTIKLFYGGHFCPKLRIQPSWIRLCLCMYNLRVYDMRIINLVLNIFLYYCWFYKNLWKVYVTDRQNINKF